MKILGTGRITECQTEINELPHMAIQAQAQATRYQNNMYEVTMRLFHLDETLIRNIDLIDICDHSRTDKDVLVYAYERFKDSRPNLAAAIMAEILGAK